MYTAVVLLWTCLFTQILAAENSSCPSLCQCTDSGDLGETSWTCVNVTSSSVFRDWNLQNVSSLILVSSKLADKSLEGVVFPSVRRLVFRKTFHMSEEAVAFSFPNLHSLDIVSAQLFCDENLTWLVQSRVPQINLDTTMCYNISPLNGTNTLRALRVIDYLKRSCPARCNCSVDFLPKTEDLLPSVVINCTGLGLPDFPQTLPQNMSIKLDMRNNTLRNLTALVRNPSYLKVSTVYLDYNKIRSIAELEGSKWIERFSLLSLVGNRITTIPTRAFENAFLKNKNGVLMFLAKNPWKCDCTELTNFQTFFAKYTKLVKDVADVRCASPDNVNSGKRIIDVDLDTVCYFGDRSSINSMDIVNTCLALLIILTVGKLIYDYYDFRKTGRLPWIISKLP